MILERLLRLEIDAHERIENGQARVRAVHALKEWLSQIDFEAEVVPLEDRDRLVRVLSSLKGGALTEQEQLVVNDLVKAQPS